MSDSIKIEGPVHHIGKTETFPSGFQKRVLVVVVGDDKYPQYIPVEWVKDKTSLLDKVSVGQHVSIDANLRGNEHKGKYYLSLQGWRFTLGEGADPASPPAENQEEPDDNIPW